MPYASSVKGVYELTGVVKAYGDGASAIHAVDGVDLRINSGEFVVIEGPSGSGKSTLLQMLGALDRPSAGSVMFENNDLALISDRQLAELRLNAFGFVFQQFNLVPTLSAAENVETALAPLGGSRRSRKERSLQLLDGLGLADRSHHLPSQLSGGEQQRVAIARALSKGPRVILADEPTGNLDTRTGQEIMAILRQLAQDNGQTVVIITHDPVIAAAAPRVVRVRDGRIVADGSGPDMVAAAANAPAAAVLPPIVSAAVPPTGPVAHPTVTIGTMVQPTAAATADMWIPTAEAPKHMSDELLHAEGVVKHYVSENEDVIGVDGVSLTVHEGEFVAITGPSGSGKTTLLNCLSGLDRIDRGRVLIAGQTVHELKDKEQSHLRSEVMGFIFQNWNLVPVFSAVENVELPLLLNGAKPHDARDAAVATLERIGLGHRLNHHPNALSGGEQQRVAIARALSASPRLVWADEPTGNLDSHTAEDVMSLLRELNDDGLAIVLVTHDESIANQATRRIYMRDGRLLADMTRKDVPIRPGAKKPIAGPATDAQPQREPAPLLAAPRASRRDKKKGQPRKQSFQATMQEIRESTDSIGTLLPEPADDALLMPAPLPAPVAPAVKVIPNPEPANEPEAAPIQSPPETQAPESSPRHPSPQPRPDPSPQPRQTSTMSNGVPEPVRYEDPF